MRRAGKIRGSWGVAVWLLLVVAHMALLPGAEATAERCHTVDSDTHFSCMECSACTQCYPGGLCDVQCKDCSPCYFFPDADGCDACDICMPCATCSDCPQSCVDDCVGCAPYQKMLDCQNGACKDCGPCYADMTAPGCDACAVCQDCTNCDIMPDCHDCRCCKNVGCTLCEDEEEECPEGGYTPAQLAETWTPPSVSSSITRKSNRTFQVLTILGVFAVVGLVVANLNMVKNTLRPKPSEEERASLLSKEGTSYQATAAVDIPTKYSPRAPPGNPSAPVEAGAV